MTAGCVVALAYVLAAPSFSAFRLELVFLPMAAFGLALATEALLSVVPARERLGSESRSACLHVSRRRCVPPELTIRPILAARTGGLDFGRCPADP